MSSVPPGQWNIGGIYFDAWLQANENTSLTITQHPVETGAAISDHSYLNPARYSFNVGVSDVVYAPTITGPQTRSIQAYQALRLLQATREPLTLVFKYGKRQNVLIESIDTPNDFTTKFAFKPTVTLRQIIMADVKYAQKSGNPQATDQTAKGWLDALTVKGAAEAAASRYISGL